jgi:hypothetical protein
MRRFAGAIKWNEANPATSRFCPPLSGAGTSYRGNTITNGNAETGTRISVSEGTDNTARKQAEEALLKAGPLQSAIFNRANFDG